MGKLERLLTLMNTLIGTLRPLTAEELRDRVPGYPDEDASFRRAFERDKEELREMGVPLLVEHVPASDPPIVGYRIRKADFELRDPGLEPDELQALNLAAAATGLAGGMGQTALLKLGSGAADRPLAELPADADLVAAFTGVAERRVIRFGYHGEERVVHPYRLEFVRGRWYLNGFDRTRGEDRWFRMDRVVGHIAPDGPGGAFVRPDEAVPGLQLQPWMVGGGGDTVDAEVWFDSTVADAVRHHLGDATIVRDDDEGLVVRLRVANRAGFRSWVLGFRDRAEVLGPSELRDEVVAWLRSLAGAR